MGCGGTVGIVFPSRTSRAGGAIAWANWCKLTARSTPDLRTADRRARRVSFLSCADGRRRRIVMCGYGQGLIEEALTASARLPWQDGGPAQLAALRSA